MRQMIASALHNILLNVALSIAFVQCSTLTSQLSTSHRSCSPCTLCNLNWFVAVSPLEFVDGAGQCWGGVHSKVVVKVFIWEDGAWAHNLKKEQLSTRWYKQSECIQGLSSQSHLLLYDYWILWLHIPIDILAKLRICNRHTANKFRFLDFGRGSTCTTGTAPSYAGSQDCGSATYGALYLTGWIDIGCKNRKH